MKKKELRNPTLTEQLLFVIFVIFLLAIVLSVLRIMCPDYLIGIFKLFLKLLVGKNMDINEHDGVSNFTIRHRIKWQNSVPHCFSACHSHISVSTNVWLMFPLIMPFSNTYVVMVRLLSREKNVNVLNSIYIIHNQTLDWKITIVVCCYYAQSFLFLELYDHYSVLFGM